MKIDRPFAAFIGVRVDDDLHGLPLCTLLPAERVAGKKGMLHGGALAGLLETAAGALVEAMINDDAVEVQPVSITVDFVRTGVLAETHANAEIVRRG